MVQGGTDVVEAYTLHLSGCETNKLALFSLIVECMEAGFPEGLKNVLKNPHVLIKGPMIAVLIFYRVNFSHHV